MREHLEPDPELIAFLEGMGRQVAEDARQAKVNARAFMRGAQAFLAPLLRATAGAVLIAVVLLMAARAAQASRE